MADVYGEVLKITGKDTKNGGKIWNICVDDNGEDAWFGYGFDKPDFGEGSEIEFDVEMNGDYENVNHDTLEVINLVEPKRSGRGSGGGRGGNSGGSRSGGGRSSGRSNSGSSNSRGKSSGGSRGGSAGRGKSGGGRADKAPAKKADVDWERKDNLIRLQSCQNTAVATVNGAVAAGAITLPAKKGEKLDAFQALIEKEASRLYDKYEDIVDGNYSPDEGNAEEQGYDEDIPE